MRIIKDDYIDGVNDKAVASDKTFSIIYQEIRTIRL